MPAQTVEENREPRPAIAVTATFTAEPLEGSVKFWMHELELPCALQFAPYNQVFQELLDPASTLSRNQSGLNVVLVRLEDWWRGAGELQSGLDGRGGAEQRVERHAQDLVAALRNAAERSAVPYLLCLCPASRQVQADSSLAEFLRRLESRIVDSLRESSGIYIVTAAEFLSHYPVSNYEDRQADELGHVPYTQEFFDALGAMIVRRFHGIHTAPYKVIVLDCDGTLWRGVCGEDGSRGVHVDSACRALQEFVIAQRDAGMVICLCSKNNEEDVWQVFEQNPGMILRRDQILAWRINWQPKSENIRSLSEELKLGLDSFVFLDDSALECAEVGTRCPHVLSLQLPETESELSRFLSHVWAFDHFKVTREDQQRSELYAQEAGRERLRKESFSLDEFLAGLELQVEISPPEEKEVARVSQLTQRTNQFNFTGIRRSPAEMQNLLQAGAAECLALKLRDRFGDYGLVGAVIFTRHAGLLEVKNVLLSCRALGRRVEHRMLSRLDGIAQEDGLPRVRIDFIPTEKNKPAREFLESLGATFAKTDGNVCFCEFPSGRLTELCANGHAAGGTNGGTPGTPVPAAAEAGSPMGNEGQAKAMILRRIAAELSDPGKISRAIAAWKPVQRRSEAGYAAPQTPLEESLALVWAQFLRVDKVGIHDNFFALGGHSLLAMQIVFKIRETFGVDLSLEAFLQAPSLAAQARHLEQALVGQASAAELEQLIEEMEEMPDAGGNGDSGGAQEMDRVRGAV